MDTTWKERHRGPYIFMAVRPMKTKPGFYRSEWLVGDVDSSEIDDEAQALLADPRDKIVRLHVWSQKESQFVHSYRVGGAK